VADFLRLLVESGDRPVVFGWHREFWSILMERLADFRPVMWTGSESPRQKRDAKDRFLDKETPLFFCSVRAGAGIDGLQEVSSVAVIAELDFSPERHKQNILRVYRDGQEDIVRGYFLIAESGSDPAVAEILNIKALQIGGIMDFETPALEEQINPEHMKHLASRFLEQLANTRRADRTNSDKTQFGAA
jgi:SNF2 family DNA or RNA helicase